MAFPLVSDIKKGEVRLFLLIYLILGALIIGSIFLVYVGQQREFQTMVIRDGFVGLENQKALLAPRFDELVSDIHYLSRMDSLYRFLDGSGNLANVEADYLSFAKAKDQYGQIRFLDAGGMEMVRIDRTDEEHEPELARILQDKSHRYYFKEAVVLPEDRLYISQLDLNMENGVLDNPPVPMIRLGAPVYYNGEIRGVVVVNYMAAPLLEQFRILGERNLGDLTLLNRDGYFLVSRDADLEWGFMFPDRSSLTYARMHPELWESISRNESFQLESPEHVIISTHMHPLDGLINTGYDYQWILINTITRKQLSTGTNALSFRLLMLGVFLILVSAIPAMAITRFLARRREQRRELYVSANYDQLTALPNRNLLFDRLQQSVFRSRRYKRDGALLFIDLDGFKAVNDNYGHDAGDMLLKLVGRRLIEHVRRSDTAARYGGDEFTVLIPEEHGSEEAENLANKLLYALSEPYLLPGYRLEIGASIGIRVFTGEPDETAETIIRDADTAMYQAKNSGKGRYIVFGN